MHNLRHFFGLCLSALDKIAYCLLLFFAIGTLLNPDILAFNMDQYDSRIVVSHKCAKYLFSYIAVLIILFLTKKKYPKIEYVELILWFGLFAAAPILLHKIPSIAHEYNSISYSRTSR